MLRAEGAKGADRAGGEGLKVLLVLVGMVWLATPTFAQDPHAGMHHEMPATGWTFMQDAVLFGMYNHQGSPRGEHEFKLPNWWMGMTQHPLKRGTLTLNLMLSLDPASVGETGYSHIMQVGETYQGNALIDRQHPHDFLMQLSAVWRRPIARGFALTFAGAPVGEPALGPVAFMHRSSAAENPMSPLGHHTFDSTHIAMGVLTGSLDKGPWQVESSVFHGAEPDENRWDLMDPGALDSWSVRGWFRPTPQWSFQVSHGFLTHPEAIEEGDVRRTTASASWKAPREAGSTSLTIAWGRNQKLGGTYDAVLGELTRSFGSRATAFWRVESTQVESDVLRNGVHISNGGRKNAHVTGVGLRDFVAAVSGGATVTVWQPRNWNVAAGGMVTGYGVPGSLSPYYGTTPWSFQVFMRVRPPAMHRMTDVIMTRHGG